MSTGDITDASVDELQIRMEDPAGQKFTESLCLDALNYAQKKTALFLHRNYLSELEVLTSAGDATSSKKDYNALEPLNGAEGVLEVYSADKSKYLKRTRVEEQKRTENTYLVGGATNLIYYLWGGDVWITTGSADESLQIYYLVTPAEMTTSVDPVLNASLHDIILKFAEAILWTANNKLDRRISAYKDAVNQIKRLNDMAFGVEPKGIGTKSEEGN